MKAIRYAAALILLSVSGLITACGNRGNGKQDGTTDTLTKIDTSGTNSITAADSSKKDSLKDVGTDPNGHSAGDTLDSRPVH